MSFSTAPPHKPIKFILAAKAHHLDIPRPSTDCLGGSSKEECLLPSFQRQSSILCGFQAAPTGKMEQPGFVWGPSQRWVTNCLITSRPACWVRMQIGHLWSCLLCSYWSVLEGGLWRHHLWGSPTSPCSASPVPVAPWSLAFILISVFPTPGRVISGDLKLR